MSMARSVSGEHIVLGYTILQPASLMNAFSYD